MLLIHIKMVSKKTTSGHQLGGRRHQRKCPSGPTPGLHNKIPANKTFARVWVAQEPICS